VSPYNPHSDGDAGGRCTAGAGRWLQTFASRIGLSSSQTVDQEGEPAVSNIARVREIYTAFASGDVPTILSHLREDVIWEYDKQDAGIPWLVPRHGRNEVPKFFQALGGLDLRKFQPKTLLESGNIVVALNDIVFVVKATGKEVAADKKGDGEAAE